MRSGASCKACTAAESTRVVGTWMVLDSVVPFLTKVSIDSCMRTSEQGRIAWGIGEGFHDQATFSI